MTEMRFIGENGAVQSRIAQASAASFVVPASQSYVRIEGSTATNSMYLNPVVR